MSDKNLVWTEIEQYEAIMHIAEHLRNQLEEQGYAKIAIFNRNSKGIQRTLKIVRHTFPDGASELIYSVHDVSVSVSSASELEVSNELLKGLS